MNETPSIFVGLVNPRIAPPIVTDPFNPPKIKIGLRIESDQMLFISISSTRNGKILGKEMFAELNYFTITNLSGFSRILEIIKMSLIRGALWVILFYLFFVVFRSYSIDIGLLMSIIVGLFATGFYFILNGGITSWNNIVRFNFVRKEDNGKFYFDVDPKHEVEIRQDVLSAGLRLEQSSLAI